MGTLSPDRNRSPSESFRLVYVGHVKQEKGVLELMEAVRRLGGDVVLDIYGPILGDISFKDLILGHSSYCGPVDPAVVPQLLGRYDALVLPTYYAGEGYPGVILEAYAAGLPVISTNWQCIPEIVTEDSGILVPPRDVDALVDAIRTMRMENLYHQFGAGVRTQAAFFDAQRWSDLYVEVSNDPA
jgi:glycosyltransferase involved in cell wall biosynthesis